MNQINGQNILTVSNMLGTQFTKVELESLKADLTQLQKTFTFKWLERVNELLEKTKEIDTKELDEESKKNLKELIEKLKKTADRFGLRLELDNTRIGKPLIRVYNRINNTLVTTIPLQMMLKMLVTVNTPSGTRSGTPGQEFSPELIDTAAQNSAESIISGSQANIII
jgi:uncharacterized FlaG/YvyC family protein